ncbi:MAG: class I mannose-6-phosphate isomerase, partial [Deltaproteobacteria bacterium]|nr:class I mannose-6-phosphate isomerase [Deltaproteobacteria bacterium]
HDWLSVQVHPSAEACARLGHGTAKTEAWYVAHAEAGAVLLAGHYPGLDPATLRLAAQGGTLRKWLYELAPRPGDMLLVVAGTLHAVGPGFLLLEVQEPSDTTYRLYDWGRHGLDGQPRPLHVEEAVASLAYERAGPPRASRHEVAGPRFAMRIMHTGAETAPGPLRVWAADRGAVLESERGETPLRAGDVVVAETADGVVRVKSGACLLLSEV